MYWPGMSLILQFFCLNLQNGSIKSIQGNFKKNLTQNEINIKNTSDKNVNIEL